MLERPDPGSPVLSGCTSAGGDYLEGEGVLGLARSFFVAGAGTVVAGLWPLDDREASALVGRFFEHLSRGLSVSAALRAAQSEMRQDGAPVAAWAGMVVLGDGDRLPFRGGRQGEVVRLAWVLIPLAIVLLVGILRYRRR